MGGGKRKRRRAKSLGNLGDKSREMGAGRGPTGGKQGGEEGEQAGWRPATGPVSLGRGVGWGGRGPGVWLRGARGGGTKDSRNKPKEA